MTLMHELLGTKKQADFGEEEQQPENDYDHLYI
jgi:hypothetical protein